MQGFQELQRIEDSAHAHVVGHAAVHEMKIGVMDAVGVRFGILEFPYRARCWTRRICGSGKQLTQGGTV